MATKKKMLQAAAGQAGGAGLDITEVFSTYLFKANNSTQTITNSIDLDGEGGMVWVKSRTNAYHGGIYDTARGATKVIYPSLPNAEGSQAGLLDSFNSDGFTLGSSENSNFSSGSSVSWTFRKAPKFFDVVTYTGDGVQGRTVSHDLNCEVGAIFVKRLDQTNDWIVYHRSNTSQPETDYLSLNLTNATTDNSSRWNDTAPTTTEFTVGDNIGVNEIGGTYVAYLFAHNDGDGEFGPDGDQDVIKCGSYTGNSSSQDIDLGFEAQWVLIKNTTVSAGWYMINNMQGMSHSASDGYLYANSAATEGNETTNLGEESHAATSTGFRVSSGGSQVNANGNTYIYIAIRRGPLAPPESATEVFAIDVPQSTPTTPYHFVSGFPVDLAVMKVNFDSSDTYGTPFPTRLLGSSLQPLNATSNAAEGGYTGNTLSTANYEFDHNEGFFNGGSISTPNDVAWMWKRAPGYFDVVAYSGDGVAGRTVSHNLGVAPELIVTKRRESSMSWAVGVPSISSGQGYLKLQSSDALDIPFYTVWSNITASSYNVGADGITNASGGTYIAYLFASLPGISKVGSYTGNGSSQTIDCDFTSGARFVLIKKSSSTGNWIVYDAERGISTATSDGVLLLNSTNAESTESLFYGGNAMQPDSSGFKVTTDDLNRSGDTYIFYAIA